MAKRPSTKGNRPPRPEPVPSDDFVTLYDGSEYHPHEGEWVRFRSRGNLAQYLLTVRVAALSTDDGSAERAAHEGGLFDQISRMLVDNIVEWSWTDLTGAAYPNPPSYADIQNLSLDEIMYLLTVQSKRPTGGESPNASSPST